MLYEVITVEDGFRHGKFDAVKTTSTECAETGKLFLDTLQSLILWMSGVFLGAIYDRIFVHKPGKHIDMPVRVIFRHSLGKPQRFRTSEMS